MPLLVLVITILMLPMTDPCIIDCLTHFAEKTMAPHSSTLAWKIPWMEEPGRLHSRKWLRVRHDWVTSLSLLLEKEMATHSSVLAWRIPGTGVPGGLPSMGSHRVGHDWSDLAAATHFVSVQVNKLQHGVPVHQGYIKLQPTMENVTHP